MTDRSAYPTRKRSLQDGDGGTVPEGVGPAERLAMVWQLTLPDRVVVEVSEADAPVIGKAHLVQNKRAVGRPRDLADVAELKG